MTRHASAAARLLVAALCASILIGCIQRTAQPVPYSSAISSLRKEGVPARFDDGLLTELMSIFCEAPVGTRIPEVEPLALRQVAESTGSVGTEGGALVLLIEESQAVLCVSGPASSGSPSAPPTVAPSQSAFAAKESDLAAAVDGVRLAVEQNVGLTSARLLVPARGVLRIEGETTGDPAAAACNAVFGLNALYRALMVPVIRAVMTDDPEPSVQIVASGATQSIRDSGDGGLDALVLECLSSG